MTRISSTRAPAALALALILAAHSPSQAASIRVPADQPTISAALGAAQSGDSVLVAAGSYYENVVLQDGVALLGGYDGTYTTRDPDTNVTMIHGQNVGPAVFANNVGFFTVVDGFLLRGGGGMPGAGVIVNGGAPVFTNNEISENRRAGIAGGVFIYGGSTAQFRNNDVIENSSQGSGGGFHIQLSTPVLVGNLIEDNAAPAGGGGIYAFRSAVACTSNVFRNNRAGEGGGGGVRLQYVTTTARFVSCRFEGCTAPYGGGMFAKDNVTVTLTDCDFVDCVASTYGAAPKQLGGGLAVFPFCTATLTDTRFDNCSAQGGVTTALGGAIYVDQGTILYNGSDATDLPASSSISNCSTSGRGGGVYSTASTGDIIRVRIANVTSVDWGGGVYAQESTLRIRENVFEGCSAKDGGAIALYSEATSPPLSTIRNNTIYGCIATGADNSAGGILHSGRANRSAATIGGNLISEIIGGPCIRCRKSVGTGGSSKPTIRCTTVYRQGDAQPYVWDSVCQSAFDSDSSNRNGDPQFCDTFHYQLEDCSPDAGSLAGGVCSDAVAGRIDRGAYIDDVNCACGIFALEPATWGRIKAQYR